MESSKTVVEATFEERTPKAAHGQRTAMPGDAAGKKGPHYYRPHMLMRLALFNSDNEAPDVEGSKTPVQSNKRRAAEDDGE
jgi:hypothetical protein